MQWSVCHAGRSACHVQKGLSVMYHDYNHDSWTIAITSQCKHKHDDITCVMQMQ